jgi:hypothetical protein
MCRSRISCSSGYWLSDINAGQLLRSRGIFSGIRGTSLHYPFLNRADASPSLLPYKFRTQLFHRLFFFLANFHAALKPSVLIFLALFFSSLPFTSNFLKMPRGGDDSDGLGDAHPAMWESKLSRADERRV